MAHTDQDPTPERALWADHPALPNALRVPLRAEMRPQDSPRRSTSSPARGRRDQPLYLDLPPSPGQQTATDSAAAVPVPAPTEPNDPNAPVRAGPSKPDASTLQRRHPTQLQA